jgi:hypothetical protein
MIRKFPKISITLVVVGAIFSLTAVAYAWNRCGPPAHTASAWKHNAKKNGTWRHMGGIVRANANTYHFHPIDGDTIDTWFNRQAIILPKAKAGIIPNTGCSGMRVGNLLDKQVAKSWPLVVALPDRFTNKDVRSHRTKRFKKRIIIRVAFLGQASCINGTSRAFVVKVTAFVRKGHKPHKPCVCPKPHPTPQPLPGNCTVVVSGRGNTVNVSQCNYTIIIVCSGVNITFGGPNANAVNQAVKQYEASHNCNVVTTPPPTPPPPHFTNISCTGFEEVSGGGSFLVDCDVGNDNGAMITLNAHSNDANSRVSGINCYSQGGTPSCKGAGTFEFRVTGINDTSEILYSSITVTASSNGVDKTFVSDSFPVDPRCGGFGCG